MAKQKLPKTKTDRLKIELKKMEERLKKIEDKTETLTVQQLIVMLKTCPLDSEVFMTFPENGYEYGIGKVCTLNNARRKEICVIFKASP